MKIKCALCDIDLTDVFKVNRTNGDDVYLSCDKDELFNKHKCNLSIGSLILIDEEEEVKKYNPFVYTEYSKIDVPRETV